MVLFITTAVRTSNPTVLYLVKGKKGKAIPVTGHKGSRLQHFLDNQLTDGGEVVSPTRWPPFTPRRFVVLISVRGWVDPRAIVRLEGLS
jgi:hypothetical protein